MSEYGEVGFIALAWLLGGFVCLARQGVDGVRAGYWYLFCLSALAGFISFAVAGFSRYWFGDHEFALGGSLVLGSFAAIGGRSTINAVIKANERLGQAVGSFVEEWILKFVSNKTGIEDERDEENPKN